MTDAKANAPKAQASKKQAPKDEKFITLKTSRPEPAPFPFIVNDQIRAEGYWDNAREYVYWKLPIEAKELIQVHRLVRTGRIIEAN